ncbi:hypothetical protein TDB9533_01142 [Thalassocella blandensis]|nr:hypothetical protein TDB9533_01142 [Thalassocella blandensis]
MTLGPDLGLVETHLDKINHVVLPQALSLKMKVDDGARLNEFDIEFLEEVMEYHKTVLRTFDHHPELKQLSSQLSSLYTHIVEQGTQNEPQETTD